MLTRFFSGFRPPCDRSSLLWGLFLLTLLLSPNLLLALGGGPKSILTLPGLSFAVTFVSLSFLLLSLFRRPWVLFLWCLPLYALLPLELYFVLVYQHPSTVNIVASTLTADPQEAIHYLGRLLLPALLALALLVGLALFGVHVLRRRHCSLPAGARLFFLVMGCRGISVIVVKNLLKEGHDADGAENQTALNIERTFPIGFIYRLWQVFEEQRHLEGIQARVAGFRFDARLLEPRDGPGLNLVLVIGESLRGPSLSLGGYGRETTPRLGHDPSLVAYSDATAVASLTRTAVPLMISRATAADPGRYLHEKSLLGLFAEAGFATWWLSNQEQLGVNNKTITALASAADHVVYLNQLGLMQTPLDEALLPPLAGALKGPGPAHRFIVLHTMGNHWDYRYRYPEAFETWQPSLRTLAGYSISDPRIKTPMVNAYDNATLYTDHVLAEIIALLQDSPRPGVLVFMSDHGENLFDDARLISGHAHDTSWDLRVPLLFWATPAYRERFAHTWQGIVAHREAPVSADNLFYTLAELGQIDFPGQEQVLSVASPSFQPTPRYFLTIKGSRASTEDVLRQDRAFAAQPGNG